MTLFRVLAVGTLVVAVACPAAAGEGQRARARLEPSADAPAADAPARAVARPAEERKAVERPARPVQEPAPAPAAPAASPSRQESASARDHGRRESKPTGPTIVTPSVSTPVSVGGVQVGEPFVVGNTFSVGHVATEPENDSYRRRGYDDRYTKHDDVLVPVYVPVPVPVEVYSESYTTAVDDVDLAPAASRSIREVMDSGDPMRDVRSQPDTRRASYLRFQPWFNVGNALVAGVPVLLPSPEMFDERNVSEKVLVETRDAALVSGVRRQYALGVGGLAFLLKPADASVYIDGKFVGSAYDFGADQEPLLLQQGAYTLELRAEGFLNEKFPVYVTMGEVLPFSGAMVKID
jgi:hypothetical protein